MHLFIVINPYLISIVSLAIQFPRLPTAATAPQIKCKRLGNAFNGTFSVAGTSYLSFPFESALQSLNEPINMLNVSNPHLISTVAIDMACEKDVGIGLCMT